MATITIKMASAEVKIATIRTMFMIISTESQFGNFILIIVLVMNDVTKYIALSLHQII
jgi:hypothetical protein